MELSTAEHLMFSTIKLVRFKNGILIGSGTGFFYSVSLGNDKYCPLIVTNKHVVDGADRIDAVCHQAIAGKNEPSGEFLNLTLNIGPLGALAHPDPDVDLCVLPIADLVNSAKAASKPIFLVNLDSSLIPKPDDWQYFDAMEEVVMIGCPNGIYDEVNKMPLARRGITATTMSKRYAGKPYFLVDMACFPGSSGSPVFLFNQNGYIDRKTKTNNLGATRLLFVGVLFAGPTITNTGQVVLADAPSVQVSAMMHLGYIVRSSELLELEKTVRDLL
jgi:hypothetical protein